MMEKELPLVSILIITWNRKNDVLETLQSTYEQSYPCFEIILVDNGSIDGTVQAVAAQYPDVRILALDHNLGIAARNNGIEIAQGEFILCLDSDATLGSESLMHMVRRFQADPKIGVINSKIVNAYTLLLDGGPGWSYSEIDKEDQDEEFLSFSFSEGGAGIRRSVFDEVGPFWEPLFFGCEGLEFSLRVLDAGYDILYFPPSIVYHRNAEQARIDGGQRDTLFFRNFLFIYLARFPLQLLGIFLPLKVVATLFRAGRRGYLKQTLCVLLDVIRKVPWLMQQRHPIQNKTASYYLQLQRQHGSLRWDLLTWLKYKA